MTLVEWLEDQREQARAQANERLHQRTGEYWLGYAAALQDVINYVE